MNITLPTIECVTKYEGFCTNMDSAFVPFPYRDCSPVSGCSPEDCSPMCHPSDRE